MPERRLVPHLFPRFVRFLACLTLVAISTTAAAGDDPGEFSLPDVIPVSDNAVDRLRSLVATDPEAKALIAELAAQVEPHLGEEARPLRVIHYEGLVNTDPKRIATVEDLRQMGQAATLVRYWQATGDERAAATLREWIEAWFATYEPTGNDVNENKFFPLFVAYNYLRDGFDPSKREEIDAFVREIGELHAEAVRKSKHFTNRYTKHVRLAAICGMILEKDEWIELSQEGVKTFVEASLYGNGESRDLRRRDTLTYHSSSLRPAIQLAMLAGEEGPELYRWENRRAGSLEKSVDYVLPYAMGEKVHEEWVNSKIDLDRRRAEAGLEKYKKGRLYDPKNAKKLMALAAFFDPDLMQVVRHLSEDDEAERFPTWQSLLNEAVRESQ
ncbi:MAG: alginate lyase family protein [Opitutales bacterium]